jgi:mono/diheme cytochrome c family protein
MEAIRQRSSISAAIRAALICADLIANAVLAAAQDAESGRKIMEAECARCHAVGKTGQSPLEAAPPFRDVVKRYEPDALAEAFAEGIVTGHNDMPEFEFTPEEISGLIAYLDTLK